MQTRRLRSESRRLRVLGLALAFAPLLALASGSAGMAASSSSSSHQHVDVTTQRVTGVPGETAAGAITGTLEAFRAQEAEQVAGRLIEEQRQPIAGRYGSALIASLTVHDWQEPRLMIDGTRGRASVRWKARFHVERFERLLAEREPHAASVRPDYVTTVSTTDELSQLGRELAVRLGQQRQTFGLTRSSDGWFVALPSTWLALIERYESPESHAQGESARDAAVAILEAYRDRDAEGLIERVVPSQRGTFEPVARAMLAACNVRSFEVIAAAEGERRAKVTYRWVSKLNLPAFVRSIESSLPGDDSEESKAVRTEFQRGVREHAAAYLDARERPRQSMLLVKIDSRWYLERIMAETVTNSRASEGAETAEQAAERVAEAMAYANHEEMMNLFLPAARANYWQQFQPIFEALVIEGYEVYRLDGARNRASARIVWNAHFDSDAFVDVVADLLHEQLTQQGQPAARVQAQVEAARANATARAEQLSGILSMPRAMLTLQHVNGRWYLQSISGEMMPPDDEISTWWPRAPWPTNTH